MSATENIVQFRGVTKRFGNTRVLEGVDLDIRQGEIVVLIGPSGSGKSTLLRCINALEQIDGGDLIVDGISVLAGAKKVREIRQEAGMVFQQFNLFPPADRARKRRVRAAPGAWHGKGRGRSPRA